MANKKFECSEIASLFDLTVRSVRKWFEDGKIDEQFYKKVKSPGRKGFKYLMDPMGAPEPHRSKWIRQQAMEASADHTVDIDAELLADMKDYQKAEVNKWLKWFNLFGELGGGDLKKAIDIYKEENPEAKLSRSNFYKVRREYDKKGIEAICPGWGTRDGDSVIPDTYFAIYKDYYLQESRPPHHDCYKKARGAAWDAGELVAKDGALWFKDAATGEAGQRFPHSRTFKRRLEKEESESDIYLARYGKSKWKQKYANHVTRDKSAIPAGYCWVGDHRQLDTTVYNAETDREYRPWITAWMDFKSGKWISWYLHEEAPNSDHIFQSFKWGLQEFGKPEAIYIDNGRDYLSNDFAGNQIWNKNADIDKDHKAMISLLDINAQIAIPKNAQAKNIEPRFRTMIRGLEKHITGYTGSKASDRPEGHTKAVGRREILEATEHEKLVNLFINKVLNRQASTGREHKGLSPNELFKKEFKQKDVIHPDTLKLLCMRTSNDLTIGKNGVYDSQIKRHYWADWMMGCKGKKVYMRRDVKKYDKAYVFDAESGKFIDHATLDIVNNGLVMNDVDRKMLRRKLAQMRREERRAREFLSGIDRPSAQETVYNAIANEDANEAIKKQTGDFIEDYDFEEVLNETKGDAIREDVATSEQAHKEKEELDIIAPEDKRKKKKLKGIFD